MDKIADLITVESILQWILILLIVGYFVYKEWPDLKQRITSGVKKEQAEESQAASVNERLTKIEERLDAIDGKLNSDYTSLRNLENEEARDRKMFKDSLEEREIIMRALLGVIGGLQELGANGPTKEAQSEITMYLAKQAHKAEVE
ncbi:MAG: hypothetical protein LIO86_14005 [Lachnospiraceae bacterium]|nr:hypothetical protein [Lachnospiraceae bacterium]